MRLQYNEKQQSAFVALPNDAALNPATILRADRPDRTTAFPGNCAVRHLNVGAPPFFETMRAGSYIGWDTRCIQENGALDRNVRFITDAQTAVSSGTGA